MAATYNAANGEEPNHHSHDFSQARGIFTYNTVYCDCPQEFQRDVQIKDRTHADRPEESNEQGLLLLFDLLDLPVHCIDDGHTAEKEDQDSNENEAVDRDHIVVHEQGPGAHSAEPHEDR